MVPEPIVQKMIGSQEPMEPMLTKPLGQTDGQTDIYTTSPMKISF